MNKVARIKMITVLVFLSPKVLEMFDSRGTSSILNSDCSIQGIFFRVFFFSYTALNVEILSILDFASFLT